MLPCQLLRLNQLANVNAMEENFSSLSGVEVLRVTNAQPNQRSLLPKSFYCFRICLSSLPKYALMISKKLEKALNAQIKLESEASYNYLAMASWCEQKSLNGAANFFYAQAEEERGHMLKIFRYINDLEGLAISPSVTQPDTEFES